MKELLTTDFDKIDPNDEMLTEKLMSSYNNLTIIIKVTIVATVLGSITSEDGPFIGIIVAIGYSFLLYLGVYHRKS